MSNCLYFDAFADDFPRFRVFAWQIFYEPDTDKNLDNHIFLYNCKEINFRTILLLKSLNNIMICKNKFQIIILSIATEYHLCNFGIFSKCLLLEENRCHWHLDFNNILYILDLKNIFLSLRIEIDILKKNI